MMKLVLPLMMMSLVVTPLNAYAGSKKSEKSFDTQTRKKALKKKRFKKLKRKKNVNNSSQSGEWVVKNPEGKRIRIWGD